MEQVKRILHIVTTLNRGGAETMIMNYYRALDKSRYQFDFLVHRPDEGAYEREVREMGGRIYRALPIRPNTYHKYFKFLDVFFGNMHQNILLFMPIFKKIVGLHSSMPLNMVY